MGISAWKRATKSDQDEDSSCETPLVDGKKTEGGHKPEKADKATEGQANGSSPGHSSGGPGRAKARMSFRAAGQATLSLLSARKRIEDGLRNWSKRRLSKRGSMDEGWFSGRLISNWGSLAKIEVCRGKGPFKKCTVFIRVSWLLSPF